MSSDKVGSESVSISSLAGKRDIIVKVVKRNFPDYYHNGAHIAYGYTFPSELILIHSIEQSSYDTVMISFYFHGGNRLATSIRMPNDFQITPASAEESMDLLNSYSSWSEKNLHLSLIYPMHIGTDPEIFATDQEGKLIPAWEFLGSKKTPSYTSSKFSTGGNPCYWDGFGAEFTTQATTCMEYQLNSIYCGMKGVYDHLRVKFPNANLSARSVLDINPKVMETASDEQTEFGCMPSFNAYGIVTDLPPGREVPFRSSGGHIHFGIGETSHEQALPMVKALDAILGVACVSLFDGYDDPQRRRYYGIPGEYRLPKHGLEYRPLSNGWLMHPTITYLVFDLARKAMVLGKLGLLPKLWKGDEQEIIDCMTQSDATKARELMDRNKSLLLDLLVAAYPQFRGYTKSVEVLYDIFYKGIASRIKEPTNLTRNWKLESGWVGGEYRTYSIHYNMSSMLADPNYKI